MVSGSLFLCPDDWVCKRNDRCKCLIIRRGKENDIMRVKGEA